MKKCPNTVSGKHSFCESYFRTEKIHAHKAGDTEITTHYYGIRCEYCDLIDDRKPIRIEQEKYTFKNDPSSED